MSIYTDNGYNDRKHYLECVSADYGVPLETVLTLADLLGPNEDFDGLIAELEDFSIFL